MLHHLSALVLLFASFAHTQPTDPRMFDSNVARKMSMAVVMYVQEHDGALPPDMASMYEYLAGPQAGTPEERKTAIRNSLLASVDQGMKIPDDANAQWAGEHSSFAYIGFKGLKIDDLGSWSEVAIVHQRPDRGTIVEASDQNPEGRMFSIAFMDGHAEIMGRARAEAVIAESTAILEALKSGGKLPDSHQLETDIRDIMTAIKAYAKAHNDDLPPDLGATLPFLPGPRASAKNPPPKAAAYLLPEAKRSTRIPEDADADWVNTHTSYVYLGTSGARLSRIEDPQNTILFHGRVNSPIELNRRGMLFKGIPIATVWGKALIADDSYADWIIGVSKRVVAFARASSPLPPHLSTFRDARLISQAMMSYAKAHKGELPPDLGATMEYLDPSLTPAEKTLVYLSPSAKRSVTLPEELTPDWINRRSSYVYLGRAGIDINLVRGAGIQYLLHGPLTETYETRLPGIPPRLEIAVGSPWGTAWLEEPDSVERRAAEFKQSLDAIKAGAAK